MIITLFFSVTFHIHLIVVISHAAGDYQLLIKKSGLGHKKTSGIVIFRFFRIPGGFYFIVYPVKTGGNKKIFLVKGYLGLSPLLIGLLFCWNAVVPAVRIAHCGIEPFVLIFAVKVSGLPGKGTIRSSAVINKIN